MNYGKPMILKCPHCGVKKEVMTLLSGNTFNAVYWSDLKMEAPMYPKTSLVQKCPSCTSYYLIYKQDKIRYAHKWKFEDKTGDLNFHELNIRIMLLHAYNDRLYHRQGQSSTITIEENDMKMFTDNINRLLNIVEQNDTNKLFIAELKREVSLFDECIDILSSLSVISIEDEKVKQQILSKAKERDNKVFKLTNQ